MGHLRAGRAGLLFARSFWLQTSDEGVVTKLTADLDPPRQGFVTPDDYDSDELPLWRVRVQPRTQGLWPKDPVRIGRTVPHGVT